MKVLIAHNEYTSSVPSGENVAVQRQIIALTSAGVDVVPYIRSSDEIGTPDGPGRLRAAASTLGASDSRRDIIGLLDTERPDLLHLHNPFPLLSARVISYAKSRGVPVLQTVHNFRHECVAGTFFRAGRDCTDCVRHLSSHPGVRHSCYRDSRAESAVMTAAQVAHRSTFRKLDRVIALTPALADHLTRSGFPGDRITVVPNTVPDPGLQSGLGRGVLFAGRLMPEKGARLLAAAWSQLPDGSTGLTIAGDGPDRAVVEDLAARRNDVRYVGPVPSGQVSALLTATACVVVPSQWREVCPLIVIEALAHARPVLATNRGGLPFLVGADGGWVVEATPAALAAGIMAAAADPLPADRAQSARARYLRHFAPGAVTAQLIAAYEQTLERSPI